MNPPFAPTPQERQRVLEMSRLGIPQDDIARVIGISPKTLRLHFRDELDTAATIANAGVGGALYRKAMDGDTACMIFWLKTRARWRENDPVKIDLGNIKITGGLPDDDRNSNPDASSRTG